MEEFKYQTEQFGDYRILRYQVPGFDELDIEKKKQLFYLYNAALWGRDIIYDQNYKYNLKIRKVLENIFKNYKGDRDNSNFKLFLEYLKQFWFSNGLHHHYSMDKFYPDFSKKYWDELINNTNNWDSYLKKEDNVENLKSDIENLIFNRELDIKRVNLDEDVDLIENSANNYYEGISQKEAEDFYAAMTSKDEKHPPSYGMNSKLIKENGTVKEKIWKIGGMYSEQIEKMVYWLEKAKNHCQTKLQEKAFEKLIEYYKTGDLKKFDEYSILWLQDSKSTVDTVHGFIEVYGDSLGKKASYESVVSIKDEEASKRAEAISNNALWFETNSSTDKKYKKEKVEGVSAKAINVVVEAGDCSPSTPIGINLPNAEWIREEYGSKSVSISNILTAYDEASKDTGALQEFAYSQEEIDLSKKWSNAASALHVDLHEIIGHGSGKLAKGIADPSDTLKNYASTLEEARADLVALYFAIDPKLEELGLQESVEVGYAEYNSYIRGGLMTQLVRIELGKNIEESHMRNRQIIAKWAYEKGFEDNIIEKKTKDNKTYFIVNDHQKLREIFGELLAEVQRIKSEGDYEAGKNLVENYGVKIDYKLHKEILERWKKLNIASYAGFINPKLTAIYDNDEILDVKINYPMEFAEQMMEYSEDFSI
ncbi:MAG: dihydrofolate reductase [Bacteroidetes bacterium]|nr:MAG: dihydrofolate reductase [Bacteroidota bacterium]